MQHWTVVEIARLFLYLREIKGSINRGLRVEAVQHWSGGNFGDKWCVEILWLWFDIYYQGNAPIPREQNAESLRRYCLARGWKVTIPLAGDICFSMDPENGTAHHVALVTEWLPLKTIAGNTSEDGLSSNGDRVAERRVSAKGKEYYRLKPSARELV